MLGLFWDNGKYNGNYCLGFWALVLSHYCVPLSTFLGSAGQFMGLRASGGTPTAKSCETPMLLRSAFRSEGNFVRTG